MLYLLDIGHYRQQLCICRVLGVGIRVFHLAEDTCLVLIRSAIRVMQILTRLCTRCVLLSGELHGHIAGH